MCLPIIAFQLWFDLKSIATKIKDLRLNSKYCAKNINRPKWPKSISIILD